MGRELTKSIYLITNQGDFAKDFALKDQIRRAAISVISNIAEGHERNTNKQFIHFLSIAQGSAGELRSQLYVALDEKYISQTTFDELHEQASKTINKIGGLMKYLQKHLG